MTHQTMRCPFCDAEMRETETLHRDPQPAWFCPGGGRLLGGNPECPYVGETLTRSDISSIEIALIDAEME